jgi:TetR/AcrR family transcriptional repressor of mexJK operon
MDDIADLAGVTKQTLYGYYPSKEALFVASLSELLDLAWSARSVSRPVVRSRDELRSALHELTSRLLIFLTEPEYIALLRVVIAEAPARPDLARAFRENLPGRALEAFSTMLRRARSVNLITARSIDAAAKLVLGGIMVEVVFYGLLRSPDDPEVLPLEAASLIVDTFLGSVQA